MGNSPLSQFSMPMREVDTQGNEIQHYSVQNVKLLNRTCLVLRSHTCDCVTAVPFS
jgi:hypothetical protein